MDESDALCRGKVNAVGAAISALSPLAQQLADPDTPASSIEPRALYDTANQVNTTILSGLQSYAQQGQLQGKLNKFRENAAQYGWFIAGSSYWSIAWINQEVREAMYSGITYSPHEYTVSELQALMHGLRDYEAAKERVANYIKTAYASRRGISDTTATPSVTDEGRAFDEICNWLRATLNQLVAGNILPIAIEKLSSSDPIMTVSDVGDYLIGSAWGLASALGVVDVAHSMGKALPFVGKVVPNLDKYISFALFTVFLPLLLYGLALAYYLPAIPFIRWISALVGWIILVVEALVAAPLWLCAHALPEGDGAAGQHGKRGYFLLLGIIIRPPLMVCGFFAAVILMNVVGRLLGAGFEIFVGGTMQTKIIGITGTFAMLVILGIVVIMTANKFFSLIHSARTRHQLDRPAVPRPWREGRPGRREKRLCWFHQCGFLRRSWGAGTAQRHFTAMEQLRRGQRPDFNAAGPRIQPQAGTDAAEFQELIWIFSTRKKPSSVALT